MIQSLIALATDPVLLTRSTVLVILKARLAVGAHSAAQEISVAVTACNPIAGTN